MYNSLYLNSFFYCNTILSFAIYLELENSLAECKKEIEILQEKISSISVQKISPKERYVSILIFKKPVYLVLYSQ